MNQVSKNVAHSISHKPRTSDVEFNEFINFESLRLNPLVLKGLIESGFEKPSPIQLKSIPLGKCGFDLVVQAKSGTGKTCVFAVLILENLITQNDIIQSLVLAPTREIAVQISDVITRIGKYIPNMKCHTFIGGLSMEEDKKNLKKCHIAIATPGRMKHLMEEEATGFEHVRLLVLDEADRLLDSNFQEDIVWIYKHLPTSKQMLTLSATYPESLAQHITKFMESAVVVRLNSHDPALLGVMQYYKSVSFNYNQHHIYMSKFSELLKILNTVDYKQCLIFSNYQIRSESLQNDLNREKFPTAFIAGHMEQQDRLVAISKLKEFQCRILVTTDLTCRGIDAEFVDLVINFDVPNCYETYLHRIGRGGRFGSYSAAITLVAEGNEFYSLARIERLSNTCIAKLPDPMPSDITSNPNILREAKFHGISSSMVTKQLTKNSNCSTNSNLPQKADTISQDNEKEKHENHYIIDYDALMTDLSGDVSHISGNRLSAINLLNNHNSFCGLTNDEDLHKVKTIILRTEDLSKSTIDKQHLEPKTAVTSNVSVSRAIKESCSNFMKQDKASFDLWFKQFQGNQIELEKIFEVKHEETLVDSADVASQGEVALDDTNGSSKANIKYTSAQLLKIKKLMPEDCFDLSEITCNKNILNEIKRGKYVLKTFNQNKKKLNNKAEKKNCSRGSKSESDRTLVLQTKDHKPSCQDNQNCNGELNVDKKENGSSLDSSNSCPLNVVQDQQSSIVEEKCIRKNTINDRLENAESENQKFNSLLNGVTASSENRLLIDNSGNDHEECLKKFNVKEVSMACDGLKTHESNDVPPSDNFNSLCSLQSQNDLTRVDDASNEQVSSKETAHVFENMQTFGDVNVNISEIVKGVEDVHVNISENVQSIEVGPESIEHSSCGVYETFSKDVKRQDKTRQRAKKKNEKKNQVPSGLPSVRTCPPNLSNVCKSHSSPGRLSPANANSSREDCESKPNSPADFLDGDHAMSQNQVDSIPWNAYKSRLPIRPCKASVFSSTPMSRRKSQELSGRRTSRKIHELPDRRGVHPLWKELQEMASRSRQMADLQVDYISYMIRSNKDIQGGLRF